MNSNQLLELNILYCFKNVIFEWNVLDVNI